MSDESIAINPFLEKIFKKYDQYWLQKKTYASLTPLGFGYQLNDKAKRKLYEIDIDNSNRKNHIFLFGSTGVGKTRAAEAMVEADIIAGRNVVFIDPKGDMDMLNRVIGTAIKYGRQNDIMYLSPIFPSVSIEINPTSHYYLFEEIVEHVMAGVPSDDDFFYNVAKETTMAIVQCLVIKRKATDKRDIPINFEEIAQYAYHAGLMELRSNIQNINSPELKYDIQKVSSLLDQILSSPVEYFSKVSTTLRTTLNIMTHGNIGRVLGNAKRNDFVKRLEQGKGVILYVQTGSLLTRETGHIVGKEIVSMIQSVVGRYYLSGKVFTQELCLYIDEMSNVVYRGIQDLYNKGRGAGVWIMGMTQSVADLVANIGEDSARQLLDNTNTKIIMRVQDIKSAETFAALGGVRKKSASILSSNGGITARESEEYSILPQDILRLEKREFYYFGFEGEFFGKTRLVTPSNFKVKFPNILQENNVDLVD